MFYALSVVFSGVPAGTYPGVGCAVESIQQRLAALGVASHSHVLALWIFFAACGVCELSLSFLFCTCIERLRPLTHWSPRNPIASDVAYAFFVRVVVFPLVAYFEFAWLQQSLGHVHFAPNLMSRAFAAWPVPAFLASFALLDLADYWRHRLSHRYGWWYGIHSVHHAENQMTFWSDERSHVLEDAITYVWFICVGLVIGVPTLVFPFLILSFRFLGSIAHSNARIRYGWLGDRILIAPRFHRTHHALNAAGRRSCNFGTALPWWDMLFGTARFDDNTVETGDAGAEPAMVTGSWGAQQAAGFRRMFRLGRRMHAARAVKVTR